jgi:hypothetical protein
MKKVDKQVVEKAPDQLFPEAKGKYAKRGR